MILSTIVIISVSLIFMDFAASHLKATIFQLFTLAFFLPTFIFPILGLYLAAAWGDTLVFSIIGIGVFIVLLLLLLLERREKTVLQ